jgi:DNA-binding CsgD family transcriptional regulator
LEWARRYSVTIEKQQEKDRSSFLKGPFTEEEMDILKKIYEDGIHLRIIADRLGRKEPSVKAKIKSLAPYFQSRNKPLLFHGLQVPAPELEGSIFHWRLSTIWD